MLNPVYVYVHLNMQVSILCFIYVFRGNSCGDKVKIGVLLHYRGAVCILQPRPTGQYNFVKSQ